MGKTLVSLMAEVPMDSIEDEQGWIHVFPLGSFTARDGRPGTLGIPATSWQLTVLGAKEVIQHWESRKTPLVVDYEHQTYESRENGQPAPAAGWIRSLVLRENGMFASVEWTARAKEYIRRGEYKFISPTFLFDVNSGEVLEICSVALTNTPALDGMEPVKAKEGVRELSKRGYRMQHTKVRDRQRCQKELAVTVEEKKVLGGLATMDDASKREEYSGDMSDSVEVEVHAKDTGFHERDSVSVVKEDTGICTASLTEVLGLYRDSQKQIMYLKEQIQAFERKAAATKLEQCIEEALRDGRLQQSCVSWARSCISSHPEVLKSFLEASRPLAALVSMQTRQFSEIGQCDQGKNFQLSTEENHVRSQLGMSVETFIKHKKECQ